MVELIPAAKILIWMTIGFYVIGGMAAIFCVVYVFIHRKEIFK